MAPIPLSVSPPLPCSTNPPLAVKLELLDQSTDSDVDEGPDDYVPGEVELLDVKVVLERCDSVNRAITSDRYGFADCANGNMLISVKQECESDVEESHLEQPIVVKTEPQEWITGYSIASSDGPPASDIPAGNPDGDFVQSPVSEAHSPASRPSSREDRPSIFELIGQPEKTQCEDPPVADAFTVRVKKEPTDYIPDEPSSSDMGSLPCPSMLISVLTEGSGNISKSSSSGQPSTASAGDNEDVHGSPISRYIKCASCPTYVCSYKTPKELKATSLYCDACRTAAPKKAGPAPTRRACVCPHCGITRQSVQALKGHLRVHRGPNRLRDGVVISTSLTCEFCRKKVSKKFEHCRKAHPELYEGTNLSRNPDSSTAIDNSKTTLDETINSTESEKSEMCDSTSNRGKEIEPGTLESDIGENAFSNDVNDNDPAVHIVEEQVAPPMADGNHWYDSATEDLENYAFEIGASAAPTNTAEVEDQEESSSDDELDIGEGPKTFKCCICDTAYERAKSLAVHMRLHTGECPHECSSCPLAFYSRRALRTHAMEAHTEDMIISQD